MLLTIITLVAIFSPLSLAAPPTFPEPAPDRVLKRASGTLTATVAATPTVGEYTSPIIINGKTYNVLLDTGSTGLWVKGTGSGPGFSVTYGSGYVSGNVTSGNVTLGGIALTNQPYGLGSSSSGFSYDGVLGLRPSTTQYSVRVPSWISNAMPLLKQQRFAVNMVPSGTSTFAFGFDDTTHESTVPVFYPTDPNRSSSWYLVVTSFNVPTGDASASCDLDTGTTDVYVPQSVAAAYWSQVQGATTQDNLRWTFPCASALPDFVVTIGGNKLTVPGKYSTWPGSGTCYSRLQGSTNGCILGQSFLYGQYAIYDYASKTIGLAARK